jgi:hypothetical protein
LRSLDTGTAKAAMIGAQPVAPETHHDVLPHFAPSPAPMMGHLFLDHYVALP